MQISEPVLIISDTHLTRRFNKRQYQALTRVIKPFSTIILNGDFIDLYVDEFSDIEKAWEPLFEKLREKTVYYVFGNHDRRRDAIDYSRFSTSQHDIFEFTQAGKRFRVEHGHRLAPYVDTKKKNFSPLLSRLGTYSDRVLTQVLGKYFLRIYKQDNDRMRVWQEKHLSKDTYLICGHSHWAEFSPSDTYINDGLFVDGFAQYLTIEDGKPTAHRERY